MLNWPHIVDQPYILLIIRGSGSGKTNSLFNLITQKPDIYKICLYAKDPYQAKYQFLIKKRESTALQNFDDSKAFIEYSNEMDDIYKNFEEYRPNKKRKISIVFGDMIADMATNKRAYFELFMRGREVNISLVLITQCYVAVPKFYSLFCY